jgi:hypothetical protein
MRDRTVTDGLLRLVRRLEPSLGMSEPSIAEGMRIIEEHGLEDKPLAELARMGFSVDWEAERRRKA